MSFGGEKLASRTGNIILLNDVFDEAVAKARAIIEEKNVALENKDEISEAVGIGAVLFSALSNSRIKDTNFTWEATLSFEGNTGPYVQYTYARAASVLRRGEFNGNYSGYSPEGSEAELIRKLCEFQETVERAANDYEPSHISRFALSVCTLFNQFYHNCRILGSGGETEQFRLALTSATRNILGNCLDLLGIKRTEEI
jgi:arginyl-tRNA synthetase